jgi:hypothetical protein
MHWSATLTVIALMKPYRSFRVGLSLQMAFLGSFSQLVPAHTVTLFRGVASLRVPRFPIVYIGIITVLSMTQATSNLQRAQFRVRHA